MTLTRDFGCGSVRNNAALKFNHHSPLHRCLIQLASTSNANERFLSNLRHLLLIEIHQYTINWFDYPKDNYALVYWGQLGLQESCLNE